MNLNFDRIKNTNPYFKWGLITIVIFILFSFFAAKGIVGDEHCGGSCPGLGRIMFLLIYIPSSLVLLIVAARFYIKGLRMVEKHASFIIIAIIIGFIAIIVASGSIFPFLYITLENSLKVKFVRNHIGALSLPSYLPVGFKEIGNLGGISFLSVPINWLPVEKTIRHLPSGIYGLNVRYSCPGSHEYGWDNQVLEIRQTSSVGRDPSLLTIKAIINKWLNHEYKSPKELEDLQKQLTSYSGFRYFLPLDISKNIDVVIEDTNINGYDYLFFDRPQAKMVSGNYLWSKDRISFLIGDVNNVRVVISASESCYLPKLKLIEVAESMKLPR